MLISRRGFLKLIAAAISSGANIPAFALPRQPYVTVGECVNWIGHCPGGFIGARLVLEVRVWDGLGYPVLLEGNAPGRYLKGAEVFYDFDLADLLREVPRDFWHRERNRAVYPNVHTWLRQQRFGETVHEAIKRLNFAGVTAPSQWIFRHG